MIIGSEASISATSHGLAGRIIPEAKMQATEPPTEQAPRVRGGHFGSWIEACKGGRKALSNFDYAGPLTETVLLGEVAMHFGGRELRWDSANLKITNLEEADRRIHGPKPREGWAV